MAPALNGMATISNKANSFSIQWYTHRKLDFVARTVALISSLQCLPYLFGNATCLPRTLVLWPVIKAGNHFLIESTARSTHAHPLYICLSFFLSLTLTARECLCVCVYYVVAAFSGLLPGCIVLIELPFIWGQRTLRAWCTQKNSGGGINNYSSYNSTSNIDIAPQNYPCCCSAMLLSPKCPWCHQILCRCCWQHALAVFQLRQLERVLDLKVNAAPPG